MICSISMYAIDRHTREREREREGERERERRWCRTFIYLGRHINLRERNVIHSGGRARSGRRSLRRDDDDNRGRCTSTFRCVDVTGVCSNRCCFCNNRNSVLRGLLLRVLLLHLLLALFFTLRACVLVPSHMCATFTASSSAPCSSSASIQGTGTTEGTTQSSRG